MRKKAAAAGAAKKKPGYGGGSGGGTGGGNGSKGRSSPPSKVPPSTHGETPRNAGTRIDPSLTPSAIAEVIPDGDCAAVGAGEDNNTATADAGITRLGARNAASVLTLEAVPQEAVDRDNAIQFTPVLAPTGRAGDSTVTAVKAASDKLEATSGGGKNSANERGRGEIAAAVQGGKSGGKGSHASVKNDRSGSPQHLCSSDSYTVESLESPADTIKPSNISNTGSDTRGQYQESNGNSRRPNEMQQGAPGVGGVGGKSSVGSREGQSEKLTVPTSEVLTSGSLTEDEAQEQLRVQVDAGAKATKAASRAKMVGGHRVGGEGTQEEERAMATTGDSTTTGLLEEDYENRDYMTSEVIPYWYNVSRTAVFFTELVFHNV